MEKDVDAKIDRVLTKLDTLGVDAKVKGDIKLDVKEILDDYITEKIKNKLQVLYEYEKHYLDLIKEYKEEIKFASTIQEDLRRERSQFFSQSLKEVSDSLKDAQVDETVAAKWIQQLVGSYTRSLDLSESLTNTQVLDSIGKLRKETKKEISDISDARE